MTQLSDKERALIAQWERDHQALPTDWEEASLLGAESAFPATVLGYQRDTKVVTDAAAGDHWAAVAAMMAAERAAREARRDQQRRLGLALACGTLLLAGAAALLLLLR